MAFGRGNRPSVPPRTKVAVFAVGRNVYVTCATTARATLTDETGKSPLGSLSDGTEVAILAWRPGSGDATRYRVRTSVSGADGWLPVGNLRGTKTAPPTPVPALGTTEPRELPVSAGERHRRFGQRLAAD